MKPSKLKPAKSMEFLGIDNTRKVAVGNLYRIMYWFMRKRYQEKLAKKQECLNTLLKMSASSINQLEAPKRSKVSYNSDPRVERRRGRNRSMDAACANPTDARCSSDSSESCYTPPRVRRPHQATSKNVYNSDSYDDSSSFDDDVVDGSHVMSRETDRKTRSSYRRATNNDGSYDIPKNCSHRRHHSPETGSRRMSRRDEFVRRNTSGNSTLTMETLKKHKMNMYMESRNDNMHLRPPSRKRTSSSSSRTYDSCSEAGYSTFSAATTDITVKTARFAKNPHFRRSSPSRSSSHRRYRKDYEKDEKGRRKPRRTRSRDGGSWDRRRDRSESPDKSFQSVRRSKSSSALLDEELQQEEEELFDIDPAILTIFQEPAQKRNKKRTSDV